MRRTYIASIVFVLAIAATSAQAAQNAGRCLESAYPESIAPLDAHSILVQGKRLPLSRTQESNFDKRLNQAGLLDQLEQRYPLGFEVPAFNHDPGRMRNGALAPRGAPGARRSRAGQGPRRLVRLAQACLRGGPHDRCHAHRPGGRNAVPQKRPG